MKIELPIDDQDGEMPLEIDNLRRILADAVAENGRLRMQRDELAAALTSLYALVQGEAPRLLEDDHHDAMARAALLKAEDETK